MTRLTGKVLVEATLGADAFVSDATVRFHSLSTASSDQSAKTDQRGTYSVELSPGNWIVSVIQRNEGSSSKWTPIRIRNQDSQLLLLSVDEPLVRLKTLVGSFPGEIGVYASHLVTEEEIAINADTPRYLASVSKVAIAAGCVDQMRGPSEINDVVDLTVYDHRDELKGINYENLGTGWSVGDLMDRMMSVSDTTATDVLGAKYGMGEINRRLENLTEGFSLLSSMIEIDRTRWSTKNNWFSRIPPFAFSLYRRHRITTWIEQLGLTLPMPSWPTWDQYRASGRDQASPRVVGNFLKAIGQGTLFQEPWKNALMRDTILRSGHANRFARSIDRSLWIIDGKGGSHNGVSNASGLLRDRFTRNPVATIVVFTERHDEKLDRTQVDKVIAEAGELALRVLGINDTLPSPIAPKGGPLVFQSPRAGLAFERGDRPVIRWDSSGVVGQLTLSIEDGKKFTQEISKTVPDDGDWHSYVFPDDLPSGASYQFKLSGVDKDDKELTGLSPLFSVGGSLHVSSPVAGDALEPGTKPSIRWLSHGVTGKLRIRLLRNGQHTLNIATNADNDGEWHSWTVPDNLQRGAGYVVEIVSKDEHAINNQSSQFVVGGNIEVLEPSYDQILDIGTKPSIRWRTNGIVGPLTIELLAVDTNFSNVVLTIATNARDDGLWQSWAVPDLPDGIQYRIRVSETNNPEIEGLSTFFQIGTRYEWMMPSMENVGGTNATSLESRPHLVKYGETPKLVWRRIGAFAGPLTIQLLHSGESVEEFSTSARDDGEWKSWSPDTEMQASSSYSLLAFSTSKPTARGQSVNFCIGERISVHVDIPKHSIVSTEDNPESVDVLWEQTITGQPVVLSLMDESGNVLQPIGLSDQGSPQELVWQVSPKIKSKLARVRVMKLNPGTVGFSHGSVEGFSRWFELNQ